MGSCSNGCIYVTGTSDENSAYNAVYNALASGAIPLKHVQSGADFRKVLNSKCLTVDYWTILE